MNDEGLQIEKPQGRQEHYADQACVRSKVSTTRVSGWIKASPMWDDTDLPELE
jgi:hypothetical protein